MGIGPIVTRGFGTGVGSIALVTTAGYLTGVAVEEPPVIVTQPGGQIGRRPSRPTAPTVYQYLGRGRFGITGRAAVEFAPTPAEVYVYVPDGGIRIQDSADVRYRFGVIAQPVAMERTIIERKSSPVVSARTRIQREYAFPTKRQQSNDDAEVLARIGDF